MQGSPARHGGQENSDEGKKGEGCEAEVAISSLQTADGQLDWGWGAVVNLHKKASNKTGEPTKYEVEVLLMCKADAETQGKGQPRGPPAPTTNGVQVVVLTRYDCICCSSVYCLQAVQKNSRLPRSTKT